MGKGEHDESSAAANEARLAAALEKVWVRAKPTIRNQLELLDDVVGRLTGGVPVPLREKASEEAHKLAGSLGTLGHAEASRIAGKLEVALASDDDGARLAPRASALLEALRGLLAPSLVTNGSAAPPGLGDG